MVCCELFYGAVVALVAYFVYNHFASKPGSVQKGTYADQLRDPNVRQLTNNTRRAQQKETE